MAIWNVNGWSWLRRGEGSSDDSNFTTEPYYIGDSKSGVTVNREVMMQASAMFCGARVLSQGVAQVPLKLFDIQIGEDGRRTRTVARDHSAYSLLSEQPNDFQTAFTFIETLVLHAIFDHGGFAYIDRRRDGTVRELLPIVPDQIQPTWNETKRELEYHWNDGKGAARVLKPKEVIHLKGPSWDGFTGVAALKVVKESLGLSVALERGHAKLFEKGGRPSGVLSNSEKVAPERIEQMRSAWQDRFGPSGEGGIAVLDGQWGFSPIQMSAVDAQYVETRKFQIEEIARFLVVYPQMLMAGENMNFASVSEFFRAHVMHSIMPWARRLEQELKRSVLSLESDSSIQPKLMLDGLMRGSPKERGEYYKVALGAGNAPAFMTQNEVRDLEDLDRLEDEAADRLPVQANVGKVVKDGI